MGVANGAYRCGPVLLSRTHRASHSLSGHRALSGHTAHGRTPRAACILCRASDCTRSQALTRRKDGFGPRLTATARVSFFLVIVQHGSGFVRTDILNQALPIKKKDLCSTVYCVGAAAAAVHCSNNHVILHTFLLLEPKQEESACNNPWKNYMMQRRDQHTKIPRANKYPAQ